MLLPDVNIMTETDEGGELVEIAYAKVNLALHVRSRRDDGYHALESLFAFALDGDVLAARKRNDGGVSLEIEGPFGGALAADPDNLVLRAALALQSYLREGRGAALRLTKNLPVASGIGGGSADAAATLRLLTRLWDAAVPRKELERLGLLLGSDVPACLSSVTQMVRGRGEMLAVQDIPGLAGMPMLLINPGVALSTARVFAGWDQVDRGPLSAGTVEELVRDGRNDLEPSAIEDAPVISDVLKQLSKSRGLLLGRMSGSGATCFALFDSLGARSEAAGKLRHRQPDWWIMETEIRAA